MLDCSFNVLDAVPARAVPVHGGEVVLQLGPLLRMRLAREHGQGRLEMRGCLLLVVDALALNTGPIRHTQIVVHHRPVSRRSFSGPLRQGALKVRDGLLLIVGPHTSGARYVGVAKGKQDVGLRRRPVCCMRPHAELAFESNKLLAETNFLFGGLRLLPPL